METITLSYPSWYLVFSLLGGLLYALFLYLKNDDFNDRPAYLKSIMGFLRFASIAGIILLLLHPIIKSLTQTVKKPVIILARDNSSSMAEGFNDADEMALFQSKYSQLKSNLAKDYDIKSYAFGNQVILDSIEGFKATETNMSALFSTIYDRHNHENIGAIILCSDGLYNRGSNPLYMGSKLPAPIFSIGVGDTTERKDVVIQGVYNNDIVYLNDQFTVNVDFSAHAFLNKTVEIQIRQISKNNSTLKAKKRVTISDNDYFSTVEFSIPATQTGTTKYLVSIFPLEGEFTTKNNQKKFYIDVLDSRHRIQIIALAPHPDLGLIKTVLEQSKNNEVSISYISNGNINVANSDMIIFHQLPGGHYRIDQLITALDKKKTPRWFILGSKSNIAHFNKTQSAIKIKTSGLEKNEVTASVNTAFTSFIIKDEIRLGISKFPPLTASFGDFKSSPATRNLLFQKIHNVKTKYPLLSFLDRSGIKTCVLAAEGIWKWRLYNYAQKENTQITDELIHSIVRYLSVRDDKSRFRVKASQSQYNENDNIHFTAERYNSSFERDNAEEVTMVINNEDSKQFEFTFSKKDDYYSLNAGQLQAGNYNYIAKTKIDNKPTTKTGKFSIQEVELEAYQHKANFTLLSALSQQNGGKLIEWNQMDSLVNIIQTDNGIKPISYNHITTRPLIDFKWPFFILILLLSAEWFMRRYYGKY